MMVTSTTVHINQDLSQLKVLIEQLQSILITHGNLEVLAYQKSNDDSDGAEDYISNIDIDLKDKTILIF